MQTSYRILVKGSIVTGQKRLDSQILSQKYLQKIEYIKIRLKIIWYLGLFPLGFLVGQNIL
jgi:hypothetical protein